MKAFIWVFLGGGLGSLTRFLLSRWITLLIPHPFPFGIYAVNILAGFMLGLAMYFADQREAFSPVIRIFWAVGFCGGFSTFSAFSADIITLAQNEMFLLMITYIGLSILTSILAILAGLYIGTLL